MRFQLVLVGLATIVCFALGGARWREKLVSMSSFNHAASAGKWVLVTADYSGLHATSRDRGTEDVPGFSSVQVNQAWDLAPDFRRAALVDTYSYNGNPGLKVFAARRPDPLAETAPAGGSSFYCPLFDHDGAVLFYDATGTTNTKLRRLEVPRVDSANATSRVTDVRLAAPPRYDDCFERTDDGEVLAWVGSDSQIHLARRSGGGFLADHKAFPGVEFAMNADGSRIAIRDGSGIRIVDVAAGTDRLLTSDATYSTLIDFSPDGQWLGVMSAGSFSTTGMTALRLTDAQPVAISGPRNHYYYHQPGQVGTRWFARP